MAKSRIDRLLEAQARELDTLTDHEVATALGALEDARRDLRERLEAMRVSGADQVTRFTAQHLRVQLAQVEAAARQLTERLNGALAEAERKVHEQALKNLLATIRANEPDFVDAGGRIELAALRRLTEEQGLLLHTHSVQRYGAQLVENIQREITRGVAGGQTLDQIVDRIAATDESVFAGMRHRAELIARMELNRAYNAGHQAALEEAAAILDEPGRPDPLLKKADEFSDKRNHPFSRALDGKTAPVTGEWVVPHAEVEAAAAVLGKRATGIVWRRDGAVWRGANYPAHYNDRGRQVPWRASWAEDYVPPEPPPPPPKPPPTPAENVLHKQIEGAKGSNPGGVYEGLDGELRYVKRYADPAQAHGEQLANAIYRALNLDAPESMVFEDGGQTVYASKLVAGATNLDVAGLSATRARGILNGFAADVLTANWDAVGLNLDNIVVGEGGKLWRIDNGGSLLMRAKAGRKPVELLNGIPEWDGFFQPGRNPTYARVAAAAGIASADDVPGIEKQIKAIVALRKKHGGWDAFVTSAAPAMEGADRAAVVAMLEARTDKLAKQLARLKARGNEAAVAKKLLARTYVSFETAVAADTHAAALIRAREGLYGGEVTALKQYTASTYSEVNEALMEGRTHALVPTLDVAVARGRLVEDVLVTRGINDHPALRILHAGGSLPPGTVFTDLGYGSSSLASEKAFRKHVRLKIRVPKETRAVYVEDLTSTTGEYELLLPRGCRFQVISTRKDGSTWVVECLLLPKRASAI